MFSKEIYVDDFFLMACLSIQVKGQSVCFSMQVLPFWSHRDGVKNCWQLLSPSAGKLQALTNGWAALKLQVQGREQRKTTANDENWRIALFCSNSSQRSVLQGFEILICFF